MFITHDLDEALRLGDRIAILKDGMVDQVGGPEDILLNPATDYVREFVRDVNRARVVTAGAVMTSPDGTPGGPRVSRTAVLEELLPLSLGSEAPLQVVDADGAVVGAIGRETLLGALMREPEAT